jgi:diguanylate cyclase (GGDEF)-like protein/PAS domain S-box-containing protein
MEVSRKVRVKPYEQLPAAERLEWLEHVLDHVQDAIALRDADGILLYVNRAWEELTGTAFEDAVGRAASSFLSGDAQPASLLKAVGARLQRGEVWEGRVLERGPHGDPLTHWLTLIPARDERGVLSRVVAVRRDVSKAEEREAALAVSEARYALAARGSNDGLWDWDFRSGRLYLSSRWFEQLGEPAQGVSGSPDLWFDRVHTDDLPDLRLAIEAHRAGTAEHLEVEYRARHAEGDWRWIQARGAAVRDEDGEATRMAGSQTDISERKAHESRLLHDALHDTLTGLPNRDLFQDRLDRAVRRLRRRPEARFAVLFVDLDHFKDVNDSIGHSAGDALLQQLCTRLVDAVRPSDTVARLGGDEFTVLVEDLDQPGAMQLAERIREAVALPFTLQSIEVFVTASVGVAMGDASASAEELLRNADRAMYHAKKRGRAQSVVYDVSTSGKLQRRLVLQQELRVALTRGELKAWFQPIVSLLDGRVLGFEALARWGADPAIAHPAEFIPLAEELGLIVPLGEAIMEQACAFLRRWEDADCAAPELGVTVNLSPRQFVDAQLVERVRGVLERTGADPAHLKVEITESTAMTRHTHPVDVCFALRALGVSIAIDDFGTGYSSLSQLHQLPVQTLKIDQSFVERIAVDREARAIVRSILSLGQSLGLDVVAEGVETPAQRHALLELGCLRGQGWLFGRAERAADALARALAPADEAFAIPSEL